MRKEIEGFPGYYITDDGKVISTKFKEERVMKTWYQKGGYENIKLCKENVTYHFLIHRLVAQAFIPNPDNLPEVNHKNKNRADNRVENLEWCTRVENLYDSYSTMSPVRNFRKCKVVNKKTNEIIGEFQSVKEACAYCSEHFNCSPTSLEKYRHSGNYSIVFETCND